MSAVGIYFHNKNRELILIKLNWVKDLKFKHYLDNTAFAPYGMFKRLFRHQALGNNLRKIRPTSTLQDGESVFVF